MDAQLIANMLILGATYSLLATGFNFTFLSTKFFNVAYGSFIIFGAYAYLSISRISDFGFFITAIIAVLLGGLFGYVIDKLFYKPLRKRKASNEVLLVTSFGLFLVFQALFSMIFGRKFEAFTPVGFINTTYTFFGANFTGIQLVLIFLGIFAPLSLAILLKKTIFGKAVRAINDDIEVAKIVGINTERVIGWTFTIGAGIAAISGTLAAFDLGISPAVGLHLVLWAVTVSIIGGLGSIYGGLIAAFLLGVIETSTILFTSGEWRDVAAFVTLIIFLIIKPSGIFGKK